MPPWFICWLLGNFRRRSSEAVSILTTHILKTNHKVLCRLPQQLLSTSSPNFNLFLTWFSPRFLTVPLKITHGASPPLFAQVKASTVLCILHLAQRWSKARLVIQPCTSLSVKVTKAKMKNWGIFLCLPPPFPPRPPLRYADTRYQPRFHLWQRNSLPFHSSLVFWNWPLYSA